MMFVVVAEVWEFVPMKRKRCSVVVYKKGDRGFLPEDVVLAAAAEGHVMVVNDV